jgi:hypothetical protein
MKKPYEVSLICEFTPYHNSFIRGRKITGKRTKAHSGNYWALFESLEDIEKFAEDIKKSWDIMSVYPFGDSFGFHTNHENEEYTLKYKDISYKSIDDLKWMLSSKDFLAYCKQELIGVDEIV